MSTVFTSIYNISAAALDRYLQLNGWVRNYNFPNKNLMVFNNDSVHPKTLAIPSRENLDDFYILVQKAVDTLSKIENRAFSDIVKDITTTFVDRLEFRFISASTEDGKIPLDYASNCVEGLKDLILYAVCAEQVVNPICYRASDFAKQTLNQFKLAQTERGSFILNVDIQVVDENNEQTLLEGCPPSDPFEHKVIERIERAIGQVDSVVFNHTQLSETAETAFQTGLTANMCDALLKMRPFSDDDKVTATVRYASSLTNKTGQSISTELRTNHFLVIDEIAKIYRDKTLIQNTTLTGIIRSMSKKDGADGKIETINLYTLYKGKARTVSVILSDEQYRLACDAHRDGLEVQISGELNMSERHWIMSNVTDFSSILEPN